MSLLFAFILKYGPKGRQIGSLPGEGCLADEGSEGERRSMSQSPESPISQRVPGWLILIGSAGIVFHLFVVGVNALAAPSGPWPSPQGSMTVMPPVLAMNISSTLSPYYLEPLKIPHNYHFETNRPGAEEVRMEAILKDENGKPFKTLQFPDPSANSWVRHRQAEMVHWLSMDQPVELEMTEKVMPSGQEAKLVIWNDNPDKPKENDLYREFVSEPEVRQKRVRRPIFRPSEWSLFLVQSYARFLCQTHGAAKVEMVRIHRSPLWPDLMTQPTGSVPPEALRPIRSSYGEYTR